MSTGVSDDVSWDVLRRITRDWAGSSAELEEVVPLAGGHINTTLKIKTRTGEQAVLKISPHRINREYADEILQLSWLGRAGLPVPKILNHFSGSLDSPFSYLLMQWIDGVNLHDAKLQCPPEQYDRLQVQLADMVAAMHAITGPVYCRVVEGAAHASPGWTNFFRSVYDGIWHDVEKSEHLPARMRKLIAKIHHRNDELFAHDDCPRLTHWDLWSGNILAHPDAQGQWSVAAILDPNCKFAHFEGELAYLDLFHTVNQAFVRNYNHYHRLPPEYHRYRKQVYQLYFMLDHVNLYGQEYIKPVQDLLDKLHFLI